MSSAMFHGLVRRLRHRWRYRIEQRKLIRAGYEPCEVAVVQPRDLLPLRQPLLVEPWSVAVYRKGTLTLCLFSTEAAPRTREPERPHNWAILASDVALPTHISGGLRATMLGFSVLDLCELTTFPSIDPPAGYAILAADDASARFVAQTTLPLGMSVVMHAGRCMFEVTESSLADMEKMLREM